MLQLNNTSNGTFSSIHLNVVFSIVWTILIPSCHDFVGFSSSQESMDFLKFLLDVSNPNVLPCNKEKSFQTNLNSSTTCFVNSLPFVLCKTCGAPIIVMTSNNFLAVSWTESVRIASKTTNPEKQSS